jgi:hypothetical protein
MLNPKVHTKGSFLFSLSTITDIGQNKNIQNITQWKYKFTLHFAQIWPFETTVYKKGMSGASPAIPLLK